MNRTAVPLWRGPMFQLARTVQTETWVAATRAAMTVERERVIYTSSVGFRFNSFSSGSA